MAALEGIERVDRWGRRLAFPNGHGQHIQTQLPVHIAHKTWLNTTDVSVSSQRMTRQVRLCSKYSWLSKRLEGETIASVPSYRLWASCAIGSNHSVGLPHAGRRANRTLYTLEGKYIIKILLVMFQPVS